MVTCPHCPEVLVADRLADHLRFQHREPRTACDHCGGPLNEDGSPTYSKRFCRPTCNVLNQRACRKALAALVALVSAA